MQSRDQERAGHALKAVQAWVDKGIEGQKLKTATSGLPAMIHSNGLGHAFVFYLSDPKKFDERVKVVDAVFDWLKQSGVYGQNTDKLTALNAVTQSDLKTHLIAQQEAQAYLMWLKKFVRALFADTTNNQGE